MPMSTKCQKMEKKITINVIQHDDRLYTYDCFTMEHFRLRQRMTLTIKIFCSRVYIYYKLCINVFVKKLFRVLIMCSLFSVFGIASL
jgi:hypothetical protein